MMSTRGRSLTAAIWLVLVSIVAGCSSVTVETGPRSRETSREIANDQAGDIRSTWANRFNNASPLQTAGYLATFIDTTAGRYLDFGGQVVDQWRDANSRAGSDVPASALADMVERSIGDQRAIFNAYDDVVAMGSRQVLDSAFFDPNDERMILEMRDQYEDIREFAFLPTGTLADYRGGLEDRRRELEELSRDVREMLMDY